MTHFKSSLWIGLFVLVLALSVLIGNTANHTSVQTQEIDRELAIERYPDEPMQLVNLRIGPQSVKDRIKQKSKDPTATA